MYPRHSEYGGLYHWGAVLAIAVQMKDRIASRLLEPLN